MEIRKVRLAEVAQLQALSISTFTQTFAHSNDPKDMEHYLQNALSLPQLSAELSNKESEFYFAIMERQTIGYLKINYGKAQTERQWDNALEIERIYVLQAYKGKGIGTALFNQAIAVAKRRQLTKIWLGVWEHNQDAIRFYKLLGFDSVGQHIFKLGSDEQTDLIMLYHRPA